MFGFITKIFNYFFGEEDPQSRRYVSDDFEDFPHRGFVHLHPCRSYQPSWVDMNSEDEYSDGSTYTSTRSEREDAMRAGILRPGSKVKLLTKVKRGMKRPRNYEKSF